MPTPTVLPRAPLPLEPSLHAKPWGGRRLAGLGKRLPPGPIGEAWEVSDRPEGPSRVSGGPLAGRSLAELMASAPAELAGPAANGRFPLLFKFLDCREVLSVQVHPDDRAARPFGDRGKEEAWVVLEADPGACLYLGFVRPTTRDEVRSRVEAGTLEELLGRIAVRPGDVFHLPPGTVHAIGGGLVLAEIQQSSNLTYRLFDWGRVGLDGRPRELHLERALAVLEGQPYRRAPEPPARAEAWGRRETLVAGRFFRLERLLLEGGIAELEAAGRPLILAGLEGEVEVKGADGACTLARGQSALVPAAAGPVSLAGQARLLMATTA